MSQPPDAPALPMIKNVAQPDLNSYLALAITVVLPIFEYVITFDQEVTVVWMREKKFSLGSLLLVSIRWAMVIQAVLGCIPSGRTGCKPLAAIIKFFFLLGFIQTAVFAALRVSAIWGRNTVIFLVVVSLGMTATVINTYAATTYVYRFEEDSCVTVAGLSTKVLTILKFVAQISVVIAHIVVLVLTWIKTYEQAVNTRMVGQVMSLSICLLRDGTFYFAVLLTINIVELCTNGSQSGSSIGDFAATIPLILVSRFILNLRQVDAMNETQTIDKFSRFSAPRFRAAGTSIFGNFGEPLEHGSSLDEDGGEVLGRLDDSERPSLDDASRVADGGSWRDEATNVKDSCVSRV